MKGDKNMLLTASELEGLNEFELRSKFYQASNDLVRSKRAAEAAPLALASLENIERALARRMAARSKSAPR